MPKTPAIQRGEGFESSTIHKPNAALEAFEELVKAAQMAVLPIRCNCSHSAALRQALIRAGEIRKALAHQDAAFVKAADNLRDCYADCYGQAEKPPSIRDYDEAREKAVGRRG